MHTLSSLHETVLASCWHPSDGSHQSSVHWLLSSQSIAPAPTQAPALQPSTTVHSLPSSQSALLAALTHCPSLQESSVQTLPSSQPKGVPSWQTPARHLSPVVHEEPSSQLPETFSCEHPPPGTQVSTVQELPSSHFNDPVPKQMPAVQVSPIVHWLLSSHASELLAC